MKYSRPGYSPLFMSVVERVERLYRHNARSGWQSARVLLSEELYVKLLAEFNTMPLGLMLKGMPVDFDSRVFGVAVTKGERLSVLWDSRIWALPA